MGFKEEKVSAQTTDIKTELLKLEHFPEIQKFINLKTGQIQDEQGLRAKLAEICSGYKGPQLDALIDDLKEALAAARGENQEKPDFTPLQNLVLAMNETHERHHEMDEEHRHALDESHFGEENNAVQARALVDLNFILYAGIDAHETTAAVVIENRGVTITAGTIDYATVPIERREEYGVLLSFEERLKIGPEAPIAIALDKDCEKIEDPEQRRLARERIREARTIKDLKDINARFGIISEFQFNNLLSAEKNWIESVARQAEMQRQMQQVQTASTLALLTNLRSFIDEKERKEWETRKKGMSEGEREEATRVEEERKKIAKEQKEFDVKGLHGDERFQAIFNENLKNNLEDLARRTNVDMEEIKKLAGIAEGQGKGAEVRIVTLQTEIVLATLNAYDTTLNSLPEGVYKKYHNA